MSNSPKIKIIFLGGFLLSLHVALTAYMNSSFLASFVGEGKVGLMFSLGSLTSIVSLLLIPKILPRVGGYKFLLGSVALSALLLLCLSIFKNLSVVPIFIIYFALNNVIIFVLDELLEIFSEPGREGKVRGFYLAILSGAWVLSQLFLGTILENFSFQVLFFIAFEIMVVFFLVCFFLLKGLPDPNYDKVAILGSLKIFFKNKNLTRAYFMNFILQFFFSWMVIYTPIYLNSHLGFAWSEIGIIFTIMLTPFVFMPIPLGRYSDKIGERKMLMAGFALASIATLSLYFLRVPNLALWAFALFMTRIGASTVEAMSDVYFFKHIEKENDEFIGIYRNATPSAYIVGPLLATFFISVIPSFSFMFLILGVVLSIGVCLAYTIKSSDV